MSPFQVCAICGRGSARTVWVNVVGSLVFCDFHTQEQIKWAVQNATAPAPEVIVTDPGTDESSSS
jgi:hypothetical protein